MMVGQQPAMANLLHCGMPGGPSHPSHPLKHTALHFPHLRATQVVAYYIEQSKANNHAVREAACACIAELMCKASRICPRLAGGAVEMIGLLGIRAALRVYLQLHPLLPLLQVDKQAVAPFVPRLLRALVTCFKDASWPVSSTRQAARAPALLHLPLPRPKSLYQPLPNPRRFHSLRCATRPAWPAGAACWPSPRSLARCWRSCTPCGLPTWRTTSTACARTAPLRWAMQVGGCVRSHD